MTKIKQVTLDGFKGFNHISVSFDDSITYLMGNNGEGKTSLGLDGIQFIFQGVAEKSSGKGANNPIIGNRFNFIADGLKSAKGSAIIHDEKLDCDIMIKRKITATSNEVSFEAPEGIRLDQQWLNDLFNYYMIAPRAFCRLSPKEQTIALGLDLSEYDRRTKAKKLEYTDLNAIIRSQGELGPEPDNVSPIILSSILDELREANEHNNNVEQYEKNIEEANRRVTELEAQIKKLQEGIVKLRSYVTSTPHPGKRIPTEKLDQSIQNAEQTNAKARAYSEWSTKAEKVKSYKQKLEKNKEEQAEIIKERLETIKNMELPFKELDINEDGELTLQGRYVNDSFFSTGQLMKIVPMLMSKVKYSEGRMKYVYIQDFSLMDEETQKQTVEYLTSNGWQCVCELVGEKEIKNAHIIKLKEMRVVNGTGDLL